MATLKGADQGFAGNVERLMKETGASLTSGYRSNAEQQVLYDKALKKYGSEKEARKWAAKPGGSNHEHGFAADIGNYQNISDATLAKYGLYRPMAHEPWHVEPVGHRAKGGKDAYTTPRANVPEVDDVMTKVGGALEQLMGAPAPASFGSQDSAVGAASTSVGSNAISAVGSNAMDVASARQASQAVQVNMREQAAAAPVPMQIAQDDTDGTEIDRFMDAIAGKESGGNYNAKNSSSGAAGKFQIMPANWPVWSKEAGLPAGAPMTPQNQERVAKAKMQTYYDKFQNWHDVAIAWYGGPGAVNYKNKNASQGAYPTINQYANDIVKRMN